MENSCVTFNRMCNRSLFLLQLNIRIECVQTTPNTNLSNKYIVKFHGADSINKTLQHSIQSLWFHFIIIEISKSIYWSSFCYFWKSPEEEAENWIKKPYWLKIHMEKHTQKYKSININPESMELAFILSANKHFYCDTTEIGFNEISDNKSSMRMAAFVALFLIFIKIIINDWEKRQKSKSIK